MKKKNIFIISFFLVISIASLFGISYAALRKTILGNKPLRIKAGTLEISYGNKSQYINLDSDVGPISDEMGQRTDPYTFTITNTGDITAYYTISLEEDAENTLNHDYIKYRLVGSNGYDSLVQTVGEIKELGMSGIIIKPKDVIEPGTENEITFTLHMWLSDQATNNEQGMQYRNKIVVDAKSNDSSEEEGGA